ncbi:glycosyltransferase [Actinotalea sp. M2MS4P-6]|uniref:glycosyltransferase n=1 Tax=Actinotalea sp. M2MS4P-6 TaxID=2983762 RepID=UPI0021E3A910|nr:glycosyltransferase [Actinotalea sp. M2MS4P-6]MCV2395830.1 glycosyltransferase [Actinotalea sp. M2MS4P-6]
MTDPDARVARLHGRLDAAAHAVLTSPPQPHGDAARDAGDLLAAMVDELISTRDGSLAWLLLAATAGHLPTTEQVEALLDQLALEPCAAELAAHVLRHAAETIRDRGELDRELRVVSGAVLADVDHAARFNRHTGIQRVTREVCSRWTTRTDLTLLAWDEKQTMLRGLSPVERDRVLRWSGPVDSDADDAALAAAASAVLPWRCHVLLPEVSQGQTATPLAALARYSGSAVVMIGYDAIPITSAEMRPAAEPTMYVRYLRVVKHSRRVAAISTSATAEFGGFAASLEPQGLAGPDVVEVMLASDRPPELAPPARRDRPLVLCVGSHEPHKNHLAVLHAAELCWRSGLDFDLDFIGGAGSGSAPLDARLDALAAAGRPVRTRRGVGDAELWQAYRDATFTVFPSLHEGFGLPVVESVACGTPAITTAYGSTGEIAARGGCLVVDPRDDEALTHAMRLLLTDRAELNRLEQEAALVSVRTWDDYAGELYEALVTAVPVVRATEVRA